MNELKEIEIRQEKLKELIQEMTDLSQGRSNFALEHFVVGQHDTPHRQRQQVIFELQSMMFELANISDEIKLTEIDIEELNSLNLDGFEQKRNNIKIQQKIRSVEQMKIRLSGLLSECDFLYKLLNVIPKVTKEEFENQELEYWSKRLTRQHFLQLRGDFGNLDAMLQMGTFAGQNKPELPLSIEQVLPAISPSLKIDNKQLGG